MAFSNQFSLSLELTRLLPLAPVASAAGREVLRLARELQGSGSDFIVEEDLANIFGRNRIAPHLESSFRALVKQSSTHRFHDLLDIILESGGPTVRRSLQNPAYFSTVVQLSLLSSILDIKDLTTGLIHVLTSRAELLSSEPCAIPDYDSLLGTLKAVRDQTSAFNWVLILDAVTNSIGWEIEPIASETWVNMNNRWDFPPVILQGCLDFFSLVQHFPEDRVLQIKLCSRPYSHELERLLIVWAHHVLGLSVVVLHENGHVLQKFGAGTENVVILPTQSTESEICLLDGTHQELFRISQSTDDPEILADERRTAKDFGARYLFGNNDANDVLRDVLEKCQTLFADREDGNFSTRFHKAVVFLFGDLLSKDEVNDMQNPGSPVAEYVQETIVWPLARALYAFSHIEDLAQICDLPITLKHLVGVEPKDIDRTRLPFEYMARLILGTCDTNGVVLASCRGWSLFTNVLALPDPSDISAPLIQVCRGTPSRLGVRKHFIIDAASRGDIKWPEFTRIAPSGPQSDRLLCSWIIKEPHWLVGTTSSAFLVTIKFEEERFYYTAPGGRMSAGSTYKTGLLKLESLALRIPSSKPCFHEAASLGSTFAMPSGYRVASASCDFVLFESTTAPMLISLSAGNATARWFTLLLLNFSDRVYVRQKWESLSSFAQLRHKDSCPDCCFKNLKRSVAFETAENEALSSILVL